MKKLLYIWNSPNIKYNLPWLLFFLSFFWVLIINHGSITDSFISNFNWLVHFGFPYVLFAMGAGIVLSTGGVDVSFVGVSAITGVITAIVYNLTNSVVLSIIIGVLVGAMSGFIVGWLIAKRNAPSLIVSWAVGVVWFTLSVVISKNFKINGVEPSPSGISIDNYFNFIEHPVWLLFFIFILVEFLNYSGFTKKTKAIGANRDSAIYSGINVVKIEFYAYILSAILASIAGIFWMSTVSRGQTEPFLSKEIIGIAIAVLGGTVMSGGYLNLYSIAASAFFYTNIVKIAKIGGNLGIKNEDNWRQIILALIFIAITLLLGKKINGSTTPIQIDRNTNNLK